MLTLICQFQVSMYKLVTCSSVERDIPSLLPSLSQSMKYGSGVMLET